MDDIQTFIDTTFNGLAISDTEKKAIRGAFLIAYFKSLLEYLFGAMTSNEQFYKDMVKFLNGAVASLDEKAQQNLQQVMSEEKINILSSMMAQLNKELPQDIRDQMKKNLSAAAAQTT